MLIKIYTCPKCKNKFSFPKYKDYPEAIFDFYQIGVVCPICNYDDYFASFVPEYIHIENKDVQNGGENGNK